MALTTAAELRNRGVSTQHIRAIIRHLRSRGYEQPLTELRYAILEGKGKGRVYFQHPDGSWEGDLRPDQTIVYEVLNLQPLRDRILARWLAYLAVTALLGLLAEQPWTFVWIVGLPAIGARRAYSRQAYRAKPSSQPGAATEPTHRQERAKVVSSSRDSVLKPKDGRSGRNPPASDRTSQCRDAVS